MLDPHIPVHIRTVLTVLLMNDLTGLSVNRYSSWSALFEGVNPDIIPLLRKLFSVIFIDEVFPRPGTVSINFIFSVSVLRSFNRGEYTLG
jgi:hypothetical protein